MALNVKPVHVTAPQGVSTGRPVVSPRGGTAASLQGPVDASSPLFGSALGDGSFSATVAQEEHDFSGHSSPGHRRDQHDDIPNPKTGIIEFTSQGFAELIELRDTDTAASFSSNGSQRGKASGRGFDYVSSVYESIIDIATGSSNLRGETVSISL